VSGDDSILKRLASFGEANKSYGLFNKNEGHLNSSPLRVAEWWSAAPIAYATHPHKATRLYV